MLIKAVQIGLTIEQFWQMKWREFTIHVIAAERKELAEWHKVRAITYMVYRMNTGDKVVKRPEQIMPLPGDKGLDRGKPMDNEEVLRTIKLFKGNGNRNA